VRVLYNGLPLLAPRTGVGRYMDRLCRALLRADPSLECEFLYLLTVQKGLAGGPGSEPVPAGFAPSRLLLQRVVFTRPFTRLYPLLLDALFRVRAARGQYDLYHETNYVPRPFAGPTIVTIYDLSLALHPDTHPEPRVYLFRRDFVRRIDRVGRFLAISHAVKEELTACFGIAPDRIAVTPLGVDRDTFRPARPAGDPAAAPTEPTVHESGQAPAGAAVSSGPPGAGSAQPTCPDGVPLRLPRRYVLFVGSLEPRKNLPTLFRAYAGLPPELRAEHSIVLAGPAGWKFESAWRLIDELGLRSAVVPLGFLSEPALAEVYRRASALAFPSLYEGFGLPLLEAMASGVPVVCSDIPPFREVAGGAALRVLPLDVEAWRDALERVLSDAALRSRLVAAGAERVRDFTWERCARDTLAVYRDLV
jgi:glycosyltransferase involved in cell wall biosynthesis